MITAEQLRDLTELNDFKSAKAVTINFATCALAICTGLWAGTHNVWWLLVVAVLFLATQQHGLFVLSHEAAHYRLFNSRFLNEGIGRFIGTVGGTSMCTYRVTHRLHHNHLYERRDPDIALNGGYPRGKWYLYKKLLIDLSGWTAPKTYAYFFGAPAINKENPKAGKPLDSATTKLKADARKDRWWVLAFHVGMPITMFAFGGLTALGWYFVLWILPLVTLLQAILRLRAVAEHGAPLSLAPNSKGEHSSLTAARTNLSDRGVLGAVQKLVFFPHHVNYHIEHHLYPAVPHYNLPKLHTLLQSQGALERADVRTFSSTMKRVFQERTQETTQ